MNSRVLKTASLLLFLASSSCVHSAPESAPDELIWSVSSTGKKGHEVRTSTACRGLGPGQKVPTGDSLAYELTEDGRCFSRECTGAECVEKGNPGLRDDLISAIGDTQKRAALEKLRTKPAKK